jgi:cytochrome c-type biogenesis protein CcmH/NrfG
MNLNANDADVHYNLGLVYLEQGRLDDAVKEYQTAIKLEPDYADRLLKNPFQEVLHGPAK